MQSHAEPEFFSAPSRSLAYGPGPMIARTAAISIPGCRRAPRIRRSIRNYSKGVGAAGRRFHCRSDHHRAAACRRPDLHLLSGPHHFRPGLKTGFEASKPVVTNVTLGAICVLCRTDSICHRIGSRPFNVRGISTAIADGAPSSRAVPILAFAMSPFSGNLVLDRADSSATDRSTATRH